ncbi:hypothetical protein HPB50_011831 [Hyalomma asiaticum]|uniref:Uncharacterized protein n=1 Tax=Hyalomma asiaticum TaxID=266040 RepID=A0ACB7SK71_HYAAI|nr:hypothetical protein HPB50_011831 [Hyalomma asiaticum]
MSFCRPHATYDHARKNLDKSQYTSDLSSGPDRGRKRHRRAPLVYTDSDESESEHSQHALKKLHAPVVPEDFPQMTDPSSLPPSGSLLPDATMHPRDIAAIQLRLPTFWRNNPQLWFAQVEATFDLHHISSEISRFRHLLCNLPPEVAQEVADVIAAPLNDASYQRLKQSILDRTTTSESARLRHLLTSEELGDRRPSQLLNSM